MKKLLLSFHGSQELKDRKIAELTEHRRLDNLMQGSYWRPSEKKGCAVTCTMYSPEDFLTGKINDSNIHGRYETELGIPSIIARLEDRFFERMTVADAKEWPLKFMQAVPVGVNLENVWRKFMIWMLIDDAEGVVKFAKTDKTRLAIQNIAAAFTRSLTETVSIEDWRAVRAAAAADAADDAAAAYAAAAAAAAAYAAYAAYAADAADAASRASLRSAHFKKMSEKLIELLKEAA